MSVTSILLSSLYCSHYLLNVVVIILFATIFIFTCSSLILDASSHDAAFPPKSSNNQKWSPIAPGLR